MTRFTLGTNLCFAINRYPEPEQWARLVCEEMGLHSVQLVSDLLNPFWPRGVQEQELARVRAVVDRYGIDIDTLMTGTFSRLNHLMYSQDDLRRMWFDWFKRFIELGSILGARAVGSHFGILSMYDVADPQMYEARVGEAVRLWQELTFYAQEQGLEFLYFETMSIPREMGWTVQQARELWERLNERVGVPMRLCLDVGHAPHPDQRDPYLWLRELAPLAALVHLQQTEAGHSRHWPFTPEYNRRGIVDAERVLETIAATGVEDMWLGFEIAYRERWEEEARVEPEMRASAEYWRQLIPEDGAEWSPPGKISGASGRGETSG